MASKIISFRLSDYEIEILQSLQHPEDEGSLNVTAARYLRSILGTSTTTNKPVDSTGVQELIKREVESVMVASTSVNTSVDSLNIQELIRQEVERAIADVRRELDERLGELAA
jgi:hypothetical protein